MISGFKILSEGIITVETGFTWGFSTVTIFGSLALILGIIIVFYMIHEKDYSFIGWIITACCVALFIISISQKPIKEEVYEYKCIIEETVSLEDFAEKYVLLDKDGEIWHFRERTSVEKLN